MRTFLIVSSVLICACVQKANEETKNLKPNNVRVKRIIMIKLDSNGNALWKKVTTLNLYNKDGLCILKITPHYQSRNVSFNEKSTALDKLNEQLMAMEDTDIPNGIIDTVFYEYDADKNLSKEIERTYDKHGQYFDYITTHKYDANNNLVETCMSSNISMTSCLYSKYNYIDNKIDIRVDSVGENYVVNQSTLPIREYKYEYDERDNLIFDGDNHYFFNDKNQIVQIRREDSSATLYFYDNNANKVKEMSIIHRLGIGEGYDTTFVYHHYTENNIEDEEIHRNKNRIISLAKFEYEFYQ